MSDLEVREERNGDEPPKGWRATAETATTRRRTSRPTPSRWVGGGNGWPKETS
jgi:hypothetical protein